MHLLIRILTLIAFLANSFAFSAQADEFVLPKPGTMVGLSESFKPVVMRGIKIDPANPFHFNFLVDEGDTNLNDYDFKNEAQKVIKYFLTSLTVPDNDLWVNLSPYEKYRIIPQEFGKTEMGLDLLAQDYILKQITSSLIYPENELGKRFWAKVYRLAQEKYGSTNIPINTFNKVWIIPDRASVYEHQGTVFVTSYHLKVMLEEDYLSLDKHAGISNQTNSNKTHTLGSQVVREVVLPALEKEVNTGKNFAPLRQVFYSLILATWYKAKVKYALLNQVYSNKDKVAGVLVNDPQEKDRIYQRYLQAFKKGVFNYIKDDLDVATNETIPRKYFSGGVFARIDPAAIAPTPLQSSTLFGMRLRNVSGNVGLINKRKSPAVDQAMNNAEEIEKLVKSYPDNYPHPEKPGGGKDFKVFLYPTLDVVLKNPKNNDVKESVDLVSERLGGNNLVADFVTTPSGDKIYQESVVSLNDVLRRKIQEINVRGHDVIMNEIKSLLRQFFEVNQRIIKRGVFNRDPALENYGVRKDDGKVVLIDIGELSDIFSSGFEESLESEYEGMGYVCYRLHFEIPKEIGGLFNELAKEYGFYNVGTIYSQIVQAKSQGETTIRNTFQPVNGSRLLAKILEKKKEIDGAMLTDHKPVNRTAPYRLLRKSTTARSIHSNGNAPITNTGGIDFTSKRYKISVQGDGKNLKMNFDELAMKNLQFDGVEFHIDKVLPVTNPQEYLVATN